MRAISKVCNFMWKGKYQSMDDTKITNFINSLLIPAGMCLYSITYPLILIKSPATILNSPINLFCCLETALVLTSDDFFSIFPPTPLPVSHPPWWHLSETVMWHCLYHVFTYIYSLLIEKDICDCQNISVKLLCICECLSSEITSYFCK